MECPICGADLKHNDSFGKLVARQDEKVIKVIGDMYRCPNGLEQNGICDSETFHVAGVFYAYRDDESQIHEGYPIYEEAILHDEAKP